MSEVLMGTSCLDPERCARVEAKMKRLGLTFIVVNDDQYKELKAAGFDDHLMYPVNCKFESAGDFDFIAGIKQSPSNKLPTQKKRSTRPESSLRNRWGRIR